MKTQLALAIGKLGYVIANKMGKKGTALTGKVAMKIKPDILKDLATKCDKIVLITGTNGKTTTTNLSNHVFKGKYNNILSNLNGSNMIQGVISPFIINKKPHYDWGIFEVDEGSVPIVTKYLTPDYLILTNFFRDQLDRYGEVENTIKLVHDSITNEKITLILNADDPSSLYFDDLDNRKVYYSQKESPISKKDQTVAESLFCPKCGHKLRYEYINYGNIGKFFCKNCGSKSHEADYEINSLKIEEKYYEFTVSDKKDNATIKLNLLGIYNLYNSLAVISLARENNFDYNLIKNQIENFKYEKGRMETIKIENNEAILVLSKNPVGLSEVLKTIRYDPNEKSMMFILNDYAPDGKDISWIWDAYFEEILNMENLNKFYCVGTRAEDLALRLKYGNIPLEKIKIYPSKNTTDIEKPINDILNENKKVYIVATFTAMPEARKILIRKQKSDD
jgi:UDP-N-acetylmuramyl tripeptide synthase